MNPLHSLTFWYLVLILLAMGLVGNMDFKDAEDRQHHYCEMVESGAWPDYEESYDQVCRPLGYGNPGRRVRP